MVKNLHLKPFPWYSRIWIAGGASPKDNVFLWKLISRGINTKDKLKLWGLIDNATCVLCGMHDETIPHLFFECQYTYYIWYRLLKLLKLHNPSRNARMEWFSIFKATRWKNHNSLCLLRTLKKATYGIWLERNNRVFNGISTNKQLLVLSIFKHCT